MSMFKNFFKQHGLGSKVGFGITEVLVASVILGFMCVALNKLQAGNHEAFLRLRSRDAATEIAQNLLDELRAKGSGSIPSDPDPTKDYTYSVDDVERSWARGLGGTSTVKYSRKITVLRSDAYEADNTSALETISHTYAKQVKVEVSWPFKGSTQSITVSGVIR